MATCFCLPGQPTERAGMRVSARRYSVMGPEAAGPAGSCRGQGDDAGRGGAIGWAGAGTAGRNGLPNGQVIR